MVGRRRERFKRLWKQEIEEILEVQDIGQKGEAAKLAKNLRSWRERGVDYILRVRKISYYLFKNVIRP